MATMTRAEIGALGGTVGGRASALGLQMKMPATGDALQRLCCNPPVDESAFTVVFVGEDPDRSWVRLGLASVTLRRVPDPPVGRAVADRAGRRWAGVRIGDQRPAARRRRPVSTTYRGGLKWVWVERIRSAYRGLTGSSSNRGRYHVGLQICAPGGASRRRVASRDPGARGDHQLRQLLADVAADALALSPATCAKSASAYDLALASAVLSAPPGPWARLDRASLLLSRATPSTGRYAPSTVYTAVLAAMREGWPTVVVRSTTWPGQSSTSRCSGYARWGS